MTDPSPTLGPPLPSIDEIGPPLAIDDWLAGRIRTLVRASVEVMPELTVAEEFSPEGIASQEACIARRAQARLQLASLLAVTLADQDSRRRDSGLQRQAEQLHQEARRLPPPTAETP